MYYVLGVAVSSNQLTTFLLSFGLAGDEYMTTHSAELTSEEVTEGWKFASFSDKSEQVYSFFTEAQLLRYPEIRVHIRWLLRLSVRFYYCNSTTCFWSLSC